jgi:hydroxyacylglutathione hydrolase
MQNLTSIRTLSDNFTYLYKCGKNSVFVVDPGQAAPVEKILEDAQLTLSAILITHHHGDHTAGAAQLKLNHKCPAYAAKKSKTIDHVIAGNDLIQIDDIKLQVIATPGHTADSVCYFLPETAPPILFTGDTLIVGACGRVFECTMESMYLSINNLAKLPDETIVCGGHDYLQENYEFARKFEPENQEIIQRQNQLKIATSKENNLHLSTIAKEKKTNIFFRANNLQQFTNLRDQKDIF